MESRVYKNLKKRKHVHAYDMSIIPSEDTIRRILRNTWDCTPSKQNAMPYKVHVIGPLEVDLKRDVWLRSVKRHKISEERGNRPWESEMERPNDNYHHVLENPYLLVITGRVATPNLHRQRGIEERGDYFEQGDPDYIRSVNASLPISTEVGLFTANLFAFCTEEGLDASPCLCTIAKWTAWEGMPWYGNNVMLIVSIGVAKKYRGIVKDDTKPPFEEIVAFL